MILTNVHNLPDGIFNAVVDSIQRPQPDVIRVTELINPPICKKLALENWDTITADASEFLWSLLGTGVHAVLAKHDEAALIEKRVTIDIHGIKLSGQVDRYEITDESIEDYKCTSVWSYLFGIKPVWIAQLNLYKKLIESAGLGVRSLRINAILRDWQLSKAVQANYPKIPFVVIDVPMWGNERTEAYIKTRVDIHNADIRLCTPDERWQRNSTFAIMKEGRKSAVRVKDTKEEAQTYLRYDVKPVDQKKCEIVERVGEAVKCKSYCLVRDVCEHNFYKKENKQCV